MYRYMIDAVIGIKNDGHSDINISTILEENSEAIRVANGGPKTIQQIKPRIKSFKIIIASFFFLLKFWSFELIRFIS